MMSHGASAARRLFPENGANLSAAMPCPLTGGAYTARAEPSAHGHQTPGQPAPVKAVSRRSRAREARALMGAGWSGCACQALMARHRSDHERRDATSTFGALSTLR
jgi:hypothetical protein